MKFKIKQHKKEKRIKFETYITVLASFFIVFMIFTCFTIKENNYDKSNFVENELNNWTEIKEDGTSQNVEIPIKFNKNGKMVIKSILPKVQDGQSLRVKVNFSNLIVKIDGKIVYSMGETKHGLIHTNVGNYMAFVPINSNDTGKEIEMEIVKRDQRFSSSVKHTTILYKSDYLTQLANEKIIDIITGLLFCLLSLLIFVFGILFKYIKIKAENRPRGLFFYSGLFLMSFGVWLIADIHLIGIYNNSLTLSGLITYLAFNLMSVGCMGFTWTLYKNTKFKKLLKVLFLIIQCSFIFICVTFLVGINDLTRMLSITQAMCVISILSFSIASVSSQINNSGKKVKADILAVIIVSLLTIIGVALYIMNKSIVKVTTLSGIIIGGWVLYILYKTVYQMLKGIYLQYADICAKEEVEETRQKLIIAEKTAEVKAEFYSRMSHDLRTPMNGIVGLTNITLEDYNLEPNVYENLSQIKNSSEYMVNLINDILDVAKNEKGGIKLNYSILNPYEVIENILRISQINADTKNIKIIQHNNVKEWPTVKIDAVRTQQIWINIISNAIKFTPLGGKIDIFIDLINRDDKNNIVVLKFTFRDTGIGMSPEFLPNVFTPFEQENREDSQNSIGSGLGMSIVKSLVDTMGGTISVKSELNIGTEFVITMPFIIEKAEKTDNKKTETVNKEFTGKNILLCEDHPLNQKITVKLLERKGINVTVAENGKIGLENFEKSPLNYYDIILMDIRMPIMDGFETAKAIRNLKREDGKIVPIIALSANAFDSDIKESIDSGMNAHIAKPIDIEKFYIVIGKYIK